MSWAPFNSVINSYEVVKNFKDKECIINKPSLSSEQLEEIEQSIIDSYTNGAFYEPSYVIARAYKEGEF